MNRRSKHSPSQRLQLRGGNAKAPTARVLGGLPRLETLSLNHNRVGDAGLAALARACARGDSLRSLNVLFLHENQIGDAGLAAFAAAARGGGLARLTLLLLDANAFGAPGRGRAWAAVGSSLATASAALFARRLVSFAS